MSEKISVVVQKYLDQSGLTLRCFADELCKGLSGDQDISITHASIHNWISGKTTPGTDFLTLVLLRNRDWRSDFALECLAAKRPEVWGPDGGIWEVAKRLPIIVY